MHDYLGNPAQCYGVEEVTLAKGKGKGMTLLQIRNGKGMEITLFPDRCLDISRLTLKGDNLGFFAPCGYVSPQYYDNVGAGFLKSFTAGFLTTCGLAAVGSPCTDMGEVLPLHGNISHTPCINYGSWETETEIIVWGVILDASLFGHSYEMKREYRISKVENRFSFADTVTNIGNTLAPCMLLYHMNLGYPLLSENARLFIPAEGATPRDSHAAEYIETRLQSEVPQAGYRECCYYYDIIPQNNLAKVGIYNPDIGKGLQIRYDKASLPFFTQWKMMGQNEYVMGFEPGNCTPDGRDMMRKNGTLTELKKGETYSTHLELYLSEKPEEIQCYFH